MESPKTRKTHKPPDNVKMSPLMKWLTPAKKKVEGTKETESANEINPTNPLRIIEIINTPTPNENSIINKSGDCGTKNTEKTTKFGVDALRDGYSEKLQGKVKEIIQKITGDETKEAEKYKVLEGFEKGIGALDNVEEIGCFYKEKRVRVEKNECCVEESGRNAVENVKKKRPFECIDESGVTENNKNKKNLLNQENIVEFNNNISSEKRGQESVSENIPLLKTGKRLKNIKMVLVEESSSGNVGGKSKRRSKTSNNYDEKITSWLIPSPKAIATKENKQLRASKREITEKQSRVKKLDGVVKREKIKKTGNENDKKIKDSTAEKDGSSTRKEGDDRGKNDELQRKMIEFFGGVIVLKKKEKSGSKDFPSTLKRKPDENFPSSSKRNYSSKSTQRDAPSKPTFSSSGEKKIDKRQAEKTQAGKGREATDVKSSGEENSRKLGRQCEEKKRRKVAKEDGKLLKVKSEKELVLRENSFNKRRVKEKRNSLGKLGMKEEKRERSKEKNNSSEKSKTNWERKSSEKREKKIFIFDKTKGGKPNSEKREMKKKFKSSSEEPINQNNISHEKRKSSTAEEEAYGKKQKTTDRKKTTRRSKKFIGTKSPLDNFIKEGIKAKVDERENKRYSYEKYGIHLPSFSEIKKLKEQLETYSDKVNRAVDYVTNTSVTKEPKRLETEPEDVEVLGCEMLTCAEVEQYFEHLLPYLAAVVRGAEYNWRHEEFVKNLNACGNTENLAYSTSTGAFTPSQKDQLVEMCSGHFDKYPIEKKTKYYFDVLLPELCLRIFMDVHGMSREDAVDYLARRPVDDVA